MCSQGRQQQRDIDDTTKGALHGHYSSDSTIEAALCNSIMHYSKPKQSLATWRFVHFDMKNTDETTCVLRQSRHKAMFKRS